MKKEYIVWGVMPLVEGERLLIAAPNGRPITDRAVAELYLERLARRGCRGLRVQEVDLSTPPDFCGVVAQ